MKQILKQIFLYIIGGLIYLLIEILFRGHTHWTMFIIGGLCFTLIGLLNECPNLRLSLIYQGILGSIIIPIIEFISGIIINIILKWNVWDYSNQPLNLLGQICLPFSLACIFLAIIAVFVDDILRYIIFKEEIPKYKIL